MHTHTRKINNQRKSRIISAQIGRLSSETWRALARRSWSPPDFLLSKFSDPPISPLSTFLFGCQEDLTPNWAGV